MAHLVKKDKSKKKKRKFDYYDAFEAQTAIALKEAKLLRSIVDEFESADALKDSLARAHALEREADGVCHSVFEALMPDFVTPIDREDIISLAENLDEIVDKTEEIIQRFYIYDIHLMHDEAKPFVKLIVKSIEALAEAMADFRNCKKSSTFMSYIVRVNDLEDEADQLYMKVIRSLYTTDRENPMRVMVWTALFDSMEDLVDQCEIVANMMNTVLVKYA